MGQEPKSLWGRRAEHSDAWTQSSKGGKCAGKQRDAETRLIHGRSLRWPNTYFSAMFGRHAQFLKTLLSQKGEIGDFLLMEVAVGPHPRVGLVEGDQPCDSRFGMNSAPPTSREGSGEGGWSVNRPIANDLANHDHIEKPPSKPKMTALGPFSLKSFLAWGTGRLPHAAKPGPEPHDCVQDFILCIPSSGY